MTVTREQWLRDIENTKKELEAYRMLRDGYRILSQLPEQDPQTRQIMRFKSDGYAQSHKECAAFLKKLKALDSEFLEAE